MYCHSFDEIKTINEKCCLASIKCVHNNEIRGAVWQALSVYITVRGVVWQALSVYITMRGIAWKALSVYITVRGAAWQALSVT